MRRYATRLSRELSRLTSTLAAGIVLGIITMSLIGGARATFTSSAGSTDNAFSTGTLVIGVTPATAAFHVGNMAPGDSVAANLTVRNGGSLPLIYRISASTPSPNILWTDATRGLQLTVRDVTDPTHPQTIYARGPIATLSTAPVPLSPGAGHTLEFRVELPAEADNAFQGQSLTVDFTFQATQQ